MSRFAWLACRLLNVVLLMVAPLSLQAAEEQSSNSKKAVAHGLEWLAKNQQKDGSWALGIKVNPPGNNTLAGTTLAVLPFVLAGHTHQEGVFKDTISKGLKQIADAAKIPLNAVMGFDPNTQRWQVLRGEGAPEEGGGFVTIWTGKEMIVWGRHCFAGNHADGYAYDPQIGRWRKLPDPPPER